MWCDEHSLRCFGFDESGKFSSSLNRSLNTIKVGGHCFIKACGFSGN